ncbi:MAG TPA: NAD-dependent epimerase/dehydratase family protein [Candidatus Paceibacterota bacterium]
MRILVTGGAGFIGSHIVDELIYLGNEVCIVDSMVHGDEKSINSLAILYKIDIRDEKLVKVFEVFKPEVVIHNAAQISVSKSLQDPLEDASINILGSINVFEACRKVGVKKIIYPASAAIFGQPQYLPIDEQHPLDMISNYGVTKHTVEHYLKVYKTLYNLDYVVLRYSNVYGPRQDASGEGGVVAIFCEKIINGLTPLIFGDGEQIRDFVYVKDVVKANILAINYKKNGIFNVCNGNKTTVNELLKVINKVLSKNIKPIYTDERIGDIKNSYMSYQKIKNEVNWEPKYDILCGIKETIEFLNDK